MRGFLEYWAPALRADVASCIHLPPWQWNVALQRGAARPGLVRRRFAHLVEA